MKPLPPKVPDPDPAFRPSRLHRSGSRIKAQYLGTADGFEDFRNLYDEQTKATCVLATAEDRRSRCLPVAVSRSTFRDAACTMAVIPAASLCGRTLAQWNPKEGMPLRVYRLGATQTLPQVYRMRRAGDPPGGPCVLDEARTNLEVVDPDEVVDPSTFVALGAPQPEPAAPGQRLTSWVGSFEDGAKYFWSLYDTQLGQACSLERAADARMRCFPGSGQWFFTDSACTDRHVAYAPTTRVLASTLVTVRDESLQGCASWPTVPPTAHKLVRLPMAPTTLFQKTSEGVCVMAMPPPADRVFYRVDPRSVAPSELAEAPPLGGGLQRLTREYFMAGELALGKGSARDRMLGFDCAFYRTEDQTLRCLPNFRVAETPRLGYSDPACTVPVLDNLSLCADPQVQIRRTVLSSISCGTVARVHGLGGAPANYFVKTVAGTCEKETRPQYVGESTGILSPTMFEAVELRTD